MSYKLFKAECMSSLSPKHNNLFKPAITISRAYNNLVLNHLEPMTGGGKFLTGGFRIPLLIAGLQLVFEAQRRNGWVPVNMFTLMSPIFKLYWQGNVAAGPTGVVIITNPGIFKGPKVPPNTSVDGFMKIFMGVLRVHIKTLSGTYTNFYTGVTTPWSGAMLRSLP